MYFALLDLLRFFSAIAVLFHHTFYFEDGKLGVYLFFIISGFVIYFSLRKGIKDYVISRFLRLFPLFWVCCTITYLVTIFYGVNLPFKNYLISMLLVNDGKIASMIDGSYWTLTFEVLFYLYIGIFVSIFSSKKLEWFYASWIAISFLSFYFAFDQHIVAKLLSVRFAPYFVFGGVLALIVDRYKTSTRMTQSVYMITLAVSSVLPIYISKKLLSQQGTISNFTGSFNTSQMFIVESFFIFIPLIIYLSRFQFTKYKNFSAICFVLGGITYPLYLLHWKIGDTIISQYQEYTKITALSITVAIGLIVVSYFLSVYELPVRRYLKERIEKII